MRKFTPALAAVVFVSLSGTAHAQGSASTEFSLTTGVDYSSGDYGTPVDTEILVVPVAARLKLGDLRFSASLPYIRIDGANIVGGDGGPIIIDPDAPRIRRDGLGDLSLGVNYAVPEDRLGFGLDFGARVKLPTAETGLGTGETDFSFSTEVSKTIGGVTPFVSAGYRILGDPEGIDLNNAFFGSVGASFLAGRSVILASYDYREATSALSDDSHEIFGAFSTPLSQRLNFTLYGSAGLSDGAPDFGVGGMITVKVF
jgi:hypothetical protein